MTIKRRKNDNKEMKIAHKDTKSTILRSKKEKQKQPEKDANCLQRHAKMSIDNV